VRTKLSIAIAVRNGDVFLKQTLDCIPNSCDLIISDNLSTDSTFEIVTKSNAARIVQPVEVLSMSQNWNFVTSHVTTEYFRLCGHDDLINPESLQAHIYILDNHPEAVAVFSRRDFLFTMGKKEISLRKRKFNNKIYQSPIDLIRQICVTGTNPIGEPFVITFRTSFFSNGWLSWRGIDPIHELDTYLAACSFGKIVECDVSAGQYRVHINSYSGNLDNYFRQAAAHRKWLQEQPEYSDLELKYKVLLQFSSRLRAIVRTILFAYMRAVNRWS
jgi:glycosyltransferase involved in cell wall biosynthesis